MAQVRGVRAAVQGRRGENLVTTFARPQPIARALASQARVVDRAVSALLKASAPTMGRKADPAAGQGAGWRPYYGPPGLMTPWRVRSFLDVFGGTESSVPWVYACVSMIAAAMGSYPWETVQDWGRITERPTEPPEDLRSLLVEPNPDTTYFDWNERIGMDLELVGNSFWLKDQLNGLGQPKEVHWLEPDRITIVTDRFDRKIGYVYQTQGLQVPFSRDEVIHYKYPHPRNRHYGMGTVEAIIRAINSELAQEAHVLGFFTNGAHISGVLTTPDTLGEDEFEALKRQYQEEFAAATNSFRVLIAQGADKFTPISGTPQALGVVDLRKLSKDEIFSGFGVPELLAGGAGQAGVFKMEEAQNVLTRTMKPKARRRDERTTIDLTSRWDVGFRTRVEEVEPKSIRVERARNMQGAGASIDESRREAGLPEFNQPWSRVPLIPRGLVPITMLLSDPGGVQPPDVPAPQDRPPLPQPGGPMPRIGDGHGLGWDGQKAIPQVSMPSLELPDGMEDWADWQNPEHVDPALAGAIRGDKAAFLRMAVPRVERAFGSFFARQRRRVLARVDGTRGAAPRARGNGGKQLTPDDVWDAVEEDAALEEAVLKLISDLGPEVVSVSEIIGTPLEWRDDDPAFRALVLSIAAHVRSVNETTRERLRAVIEEGVRRGYAIHRIAQGYDREDYPGIMGVFDQASESRALTIARTETGMFYNGTTVLSGLAHGADRYGVLDGHFDEQCARADGQVWTAEQALRDPLGHPNCVRTFVPEVT